MVCIRVPRKLHSGKWIHDISSLFMFIDCSEGTLSLFTLILPFLSSSSLILTFLSSSSLIPTFLYSSFVDRSWLLHRHAQHHLSLHIFTFIATTFTL